MTGLHYVSAEPIGKVAIVGGGTAGWSAAACLARFLRNRGASVTLIESSRLGTVGVGEASLPNLRNFNAYVGLREDEFLAATGGTFKLGIRFENWRGDGGAFFHPFSDYGVPLDGLDFHQCLFEAQRRGYECELADFSLSAGMAHACRFAQPIDEPDSPLSQFGYAYHFDAGRYAARLKDIAQKGGVIHIDALVTHVALDPESGFIKQLMLDNGSRLEADLFIDCSGFRALLIEGALATGYESWQRWLPCDRAVALQCEADPLAPLAPFTVARARDCGWSWRIPLQHRIGNGYVYSSAHCEAEDAEGEIVGALEGRPLTEPNHQRFTAGMRRKFWNRNCIALGLAGGFIEPLESTSINLVHRALSILMDHFPSKDCDPRLAKLTNTAFAGEQERIRDFIILHYWLSGRKDTPFWRDIRAAGIPDSLAEKIDAYRANGTLLQGQYESFRPESWLTILHGFAVQPDTLDTRLCDLDFQRVIHALDTMQRNIADAARSAPLHAQMIERFAREAQPA